MNTFFTADEHYFHTNIIKHCNRPFAHAHEMNETIIANFNAVVTKNDATWHLGDFMWLNDPIKVIHILSRLNGEHHVMQGNHDKWWKRLTTNAFTYPPNIHFEPPLMEIGVEGRRIILCHYALAVWRGNHRGNWHLHGHSHGNYKSGKGLILDVGVDTHYYYPWSFQQVSEYMAKRKMEMLDHHQKNMESA